MVLDPRDADRALPAGRPRESRSLLVRDFNRDVLPRPVRGVLRVDELEARKVQRVVGQADRVGNARQEEARRLVVLRVGVLERVAQLAGWDRTAERVLARLQRWAAVAGVRIREVCRAQGGAVTASSRGSRRRRPESLLRLLRLLLDVLECLVELAEQSHGWRL